MTGSLTFINGPLAGKEIILHEGCSMVIGRSSDCDIHVPSGGVSRRHCLVTGDDEVISVLDCGSANGTYVNGECIFRHVFHDGDTVALGPVQFEVEISPEESGDAGVFQEGGRIHWVCEECGRPIGTRSTDETAMYSPGRRLYCGRCRKIDDLVGTILGNYRVTRKIAQGRTGVVYKAEHEILKRHVALKILRGGLAADSEMVRRFFRGAATAARLHHRNIVHVYDAGQADGICYLAVEYINGPTVEDIIFTQGFDRIDRVTRIARQVARALVHAYRHDIVHRDVKPANIMITLKGEAKLCDLGLAKHYGHPDTSIITRAGESLGTPDYLSPEQVEDVTRVDARSDIYSFGATLYEMLAGRPPFEAAGLADKLFKTQHEAPPPLHRFRPDIPGRLAAVIEKMMAKDPGERYQTPQELLEALQEVQAQATSIRTNSTSGSSST